MANLNELKPVGNITPFGKFCCTIGNLPTSYMTSLTYEEQLLWLCDYLQNTVIPAVNTNAEAVAELQELYVQLKNYVDHYFDNLDIQNQINKKLDEMASDGTLENIINSQIFTDINNKILQNSQDIASNTENINNKISKNEPNSISMNMLSDEVKTAMTGGSTPVVAENSVSSQSIQNNAIDILHFNNLLQNNFIQKFSEYLPLGNNFSGYAYVNEENEFAINPDNNYKHFIINLTKNNIYLINSYNYIVMCGILIVDSDNNIVYNSNPNKDSSITPCYNLFRCNKDGLKAYISTHSVSPSSSWRNYIVGCRSLNNVFSSLNIDNSIQLLKTFSNFYVSINSTLNNMPDITEIEDSSIEIYSMLKGQSYNITGYNFSAVATLALLNENNLVTYISSTTNIGNNTQFFNYSFTAKENGFIVISKFRNLARATITINTPFSNSDNLNNINLSCDGDSLIQGNENDFTSFADILANSYNFNLQNLAVGGGTIASGTKSGQTDRHWICQSVTNLNPNSDFIIVGGGVNDYWNNVPLGEFIENYNSSEIDSSNFYGGLELLAKNLIDNFPNSKIIFLVYHRINNIFTTQNDINLTFEPYYQAILKVMNKYSIPVLDLTKNSQFNTIISSYKTNYTCNSDGVHPNTNGYNLFYCNKIYEFMKTL